MSSPLIGNSRIIKNLLAMISGGRIPHAIVIEGEQGLGKNTLAKFIAKACLCSQEKNPCLECKNCHLIDVGSHPDCLLISPEGASIKVDQIRALRNEAFLSPMAARGRVFIIDNAHTMNPNAQNALLKVLEEPPFGVTFILLAKNAAMLLETIRSRCITFTLAPVPLEECGANRVAELTGATQSEALKLLISADGNIGRASEMFSGDVSSLYPVAQELLLFASQNKRYDILKSLQPYAKKREQIKELISELKIVVGKEIKKKAVKELSSFTESKLNKCYFELENIEAQLEFNPSASLIFCRITDALTQI